MKSERPSIGKLCVMLIASALSAGFALPAAAQPTAVFPPLTFPGPYPVACSNVAQDFTRLRPGEDVQAYWEGVARDDGSPRYITDLLSDPANTLTASVTAPDDSEVYGSFAGQTLPYVVIVCYPTASNNTRPDYALANGKSVPHMQQGAEAPLWPDATTRFPVLVFSHGYLGSPTSNDYIDAIALMASFGYVVAAPFHGDGRFGTCNWIASTTCRTWSCTCATSLRCRQCVPCRCRRPSISCSPRRNGAITWIPCKWAASARASAGNRCC